ncbi:MAG: hypothetical protein NTX65_14020 [Ignavibacteriales bacterium]|nr:hypothetical protein [Ignavibacteriales bacterium]
MQTEKPLVELKNIFDETTPLKVQRIVALWGFSEAAFGGILHALKIPFTGLFLGCAAVIFITLIAHYSNDKLAILRATLIVILVKAFVSPYSPITAYFAVALQGVLGYLFFSLIKYERAAALLLGFFSLLFSALQKLIFLSLIFGTGLWKSIDLFVDFVLSQIPIFKQSTTFSFSIILISIYAGIHIFSGIYIGIKAALIPRWLISKSESFEKMKIDFAENEDYFKKSKKKKRWFKRSSGILLFLFLFGLMILSFYFPQLGKNRAYEIMFTLVRAIVITFFWFSIISPFVIKHFKKFLEKKNFRHASEMNEVTALFPGFKQIINFCWRISSLKKGTKRIRKFFSDSLALLLLAEIKID